MRNKTVSIALRHGGLRAGLAHLSARVLGDPRFLRPTSTIDFRHFGLNSSATLEGFIKELIPSKSDADIKRALNDCKKGIVALEKVNLNKLSFPERWNSGNNLQLLIAAVVLLLKPTVVVETGSANGASAAAICFALERNQVGHLWSYDIESVVGQLVPDNLRPRVTFVKVTGAEKDLKNELEKLDLESGVSIFLHDSDHSYRGQKSDYTIAQKLGFTYILSDDVDASLAFCDFAREHGFVFYDIPKFIGAVLGSKL